MVEQSSEETKQSTPRVIGEGQEIPVRHRAKFVPDGTLLSHELRRKLWEGQLPLKIELAINDNNTLEIPRSLYIMAPRENYFFFILNEVKNMFDEYAPQDKVESYKEMWFEYNKTDLKWGVPIGVQFDTHVGLQNKKDETPWCLTFHYKDNPNPNQFVQNAMKTFHFNFMHSLKESQCLRMGDANEIMQFMMHKDEKKMIEEGLFKNNYEAFWEQNDKLLFKHIGDIKRYAIRVFTNTHHTFVQLNRPLTALPMTSDGEIENQDSQPFKDWMEDASSLTVGQVLADSFPQLFENMLNDDCTESVIEPANERMEILSQGVPIDLNTQMYWMQMNLCYPDGFVYISFHFRQQ